MVKGDHMLAWLKNLFGDAPPPSLPRPSQVSVEEVHQALSQFDDRMKADAAARREMDAVYRRAAMQAATRQIRDNEPN